MKKTQDKINEIFDEIEIEDNEEKVLLCITGKYNNDTLQSEIVLQVNGNKLILAKVIQELLNEEKASEFSELINVQFDEEN